MSRSRVGGHFIEGAKGEIFVLSRGVVVPGHGGVLVVPPFAEEMNKCRRMVTEVALALEQHGLASVVPDLFGTGDSAGGFSEADLATWCDDLGRVAAWSGARGTPIAAMLGIRLGCALAASAISAGVMHPVHSTVLWQPVFVGARFLQQFLRLRLVAGLVQERKESLTELRRRLSSDETLEVAGYGLSGGLARGLEALVVPQTLPAAFGRVGWMEIVREAGAALPPPSVALIDRTTASGGCVRLQTFTGEPFWAATEVVSHAEIVAATVEQFVATVRDKVD